MFSRLPYGIATVWVPLKGLDGSIIAFNKGLGKLLGSTNVF